VELIFVLLLKEVTKLDIGWIISMGIFASRKRGDVKLDLEAIS
jgi:hypothetical protein